MGKINCSSIANQQPWLNSDGSYKSDKEIELLGKQWSYQVWNQYFRSLEDNRKEELLDDERAVKELSTDDYINLFHSISDENSVPHLKIAVHCCLNQLPERQRQIVRLAYWEDATQDEIAEKLGISRSSVRVHLHRAKEKIKELIVSKRFNNISEAVKEIAA